MFAFNYMGYDGSGQNGNLEKYFPHPEWWWLMKVGGGVDGLCVCGGGVRTYIDHFTSLFQDFSLKNKKTKTKKCLTKI